MTTRARQRRRRPKSRRSPSASIWLFALAIAFVILCLAIPECLRRSRERAARRLTTQEARDANAAIPFSALPRKAKAYRFRGPSVAREQAINCLATAALYEAGDDERGRKAVMQVVLNRVRSPGYPKTVCGVVYQGATRATGCQFSFACDGSQARRPERVGRSTARQEARQALAGNVFRPVGAATHYHAEWVVPYWISSLDKIAQVHGHIFYEAHRNGG